MSTLTVGTISEKVTDAGVAVDGVTLKDGGAVFTSAVTATDNTVDLGASSTRFKDLYLSGGAYIGGTGSANYLDDYEEGSFTATMSNSVTLDSNFQTLHYTKIGRQVHVHGNLRVLNSNGGSALVVNNLPFTSQNATNAISTTTTLSLSNFNVPMVTSGTNDTVDFYGELGVNSTALHFFQSRDNNNTIVLGGDNDGFFTFGITYFTA